MTNSVVYIVAWVGSCSISELEIHPSRPSWFYGFSSTVCCWVLFLFRWMGQPLYTTWCFSLATFNKLSIFSYLVLIIIWGFFLLPTLHAFYIEISISFPSSWKLSVMTFFFAFSFFFSMPLGWDSSPSMHRTHRFGPFIVLHISWSSHWYLFFSLCLVWIALVPLYCL